LFSGNFTGGEIGNVHLNITYGIGAVSGRFGFEDITIAGLTVRNAQVGSVNGAFFSANNASGLLGMGFPVLTSEFPGTDPTKNDPATVENYLPLFFKMVHQNLTSPMFSMAPDRNGSNGLLAFGGVPPVNTTGKTATAPILTVSAIPSLLKGKELYVTNWVIYYFQSAEMPEIHHIVTQPIFYTIMVDSAIFAGPENSTFTVNDTQFMAIVDSGTTAMLLPTSKFPACCPHEGHSLQEALPS
jgi:hypothetical protein